MWGSFAAVLDAIALDYPAFDLLIITGDVAQDEQLDTYLRVREMLQARGWLLKTRLIPGNHESRRLMTQAFPELFPDPALANCVSVSAGGWRVIAMDTHDTDASDGELLLTFTPLRALYIHKFTSTYLYLSTYTVRSAPLIIVIYGSISADCL